LNSLKKEACGLLNPTASAVLRPSRGMDERVKTQALPWGSQISEVDFGNLPKRPPAAFPSPFTIRRTSQYASWLRISGALHPGIFEQPEKRSMGLLNPEFHQPRVGDLDFTIKVSLD